MAWNVVKIDNLLLGMSVSSKEEADKWREIYCNKYRGMFVTVDCGDVQQTCDIPSEADLKNIRRRK